MTTCIQSSLDFYKNIHCFCYVLLDPDFDLFFGIRKFDSWVIFLCKQSFWPGKTIYCYWKKWMIGEWELLLWVGLNPFLWECVNWLKCLLLMTGVSAIVPSCVSFIDKGVPKGSVSGPILFHLFDLPVELNNVNAFLYAEVTSIVLSQVEREDLEVQCFL